MGTVSNDKNGITEVQNDGVVSFFKIADTVITNVKGWSTDPQIADRFTVDEATGDVLTYKQGT